jgi:hypothetical protein
MKENDFNKDAPEIKGESLLRDTFSHYIRLIGDADRKARIMIVVNSILLTICITMITKSILFGPPVWISITLLIVSNLFALFFTILSVKPDIHTTKAKDTENNMLHYSRPSELTLPEYTERIMATMQDNDLKTDATIKELYYFGNLLSKKYKLINVALRCFFWGLVAAFISYMIIILIYGTGVVLPK